MARYRLTASSTVKPGGPPGVSLLYYPKAKQTEANGGETVHAPIREFRTALFLHLVPHTYIHKSIPVSLRQTHGLVFCCYFSNGTLR